MTTTVRGFDAVARTALLTAALRARETRRPDRLYEDPYADALAGRAGQDLFDEVAAMTAANRGAVESDGRRLPNTLDYNAIRTRYIDDWVGATLAPGGFGQVVIAAAGMDTRTHRLRWPHPVDVYEIDRAAVLEFKERALARHRLPAEVRRRFVPADLVTDDWRAELLEAGFDPARPTVWVLEGLLYYITGAQTHALLGQLGEFCPPGTPVICDLINEVALNAPSTKRLLGLFAQWGSPWLFGSDEPEELFRSYGFDAVAVQPGEPGARYGRWKDSVLPRDVPDIPRVFYVHGTRV